MDENTYECGIAQAKTSLITYAWTKPAILKIWLFGSRIHGKPTEDSDLDIAIELDPQTRPQGYSYPKNWKPENEVFTEEIQPLVSFPVHISQLYSDCHEPDLRESFAMGWLIFDRRGKSS
jgi:predicted nucleotidyltransferase